MPDDFAHLLETLELCLERCRELEQAQREGLRWKREKWIERRACIQALVEQAAEEAASLSLVYSGATNG